MRFAGGKWPRSVTRFGVILLSSLLVLACESFLLAAEQLSEGARLELSRTVRPWEFLSAVGKRAGLYGNEAGQMEAWVYPLKILREFHLLFHVDGRILPANSLARTVVVRPESSTILYSGDTFTVRETFFVPVEEPGAVILMEVETEGPLEVEAMFERDFQLEWPAAAGGTFGSWDASLQAFYFGEEQRRFAAFVGSPTAKEVRQEYATNYSESRENRFRLGATPKGKETKVIVIAGSVTGPAEAEKTYRKLATSHAELLRESAKYYGSYLARTVHLELPDEQLRKAYDWSRVAVVQGMVKNPFLGEGLVAGYGTAGTGQRPGFAWFFGRDSLWTDVALDAAGDFASTRTALEFIGKFQREDGKIPHEIAQSASLVDWFKGYPYAYASADATPLYLIAMNDYATESGDVAFVNEKWPSVWKAYEFLKSTYGTKGLPQNFGIGHGWVEGGPLLPVTTELYQSGLGAEALRALSNLARLTGKEELSKQLAQEFEKQRSLVNEAFWSVEKKMYAFGLDREDKQVEEATVLSTVAMWFGVLDQTKAAQMIAILSGFDHQTDWGMRIISGRSAKFSGGGYHYGSVWPLFTGWASVGEYRYHRAFPAYANLRANALLALDGSPGHVTEVLSGDWYQPLATSSPQQVWSAAMVVSPLLRGMLGLATDANSGTITLAPHLPANWTSFAVRNVRLGSTALDLVYRRTVDGITLEVARKGQGSATLVFQPAISLRASVTGADLNGKRSEFELAANDVDQHVQTRCALKEGTNTLRIRLRNDFDLSYDATLPALGGVSEGLRVLSEAWSAARDKLQLELSGAAGAAYDLNVWNPAQIKSTDGTELVKSADGSSRLQLRFPPSEASFYTAKKITIQFVATRRPAKKP